MSQESLSEALSIMGFQTLPSMSELRKMWLKKSQILHPDKFTDEDEKISKTKQFQDLNNAYQVIGKYLIKENLKKEKQRKNEKQEKENEDEKDDEKDEHEFFKQFNMDIRNKDSHTVIIENDAAQAWKAVFERKYGMPEDKGANGLIFRVPNYKVGVKSCNITIHLYPLPKSNKKSKLLIQSGNQHLNDIFVFKELREMYKEVRKMKKTQPIYTSMRTPKPRSAKTTFSTKPKLTPTQKLKRTCNFCNETFVTLGETKAHMKSEHNENSKEGEEGIEEVENFSDTSEDEDDQNDETNDLNDSVRTKMEMEKNARKCKLCNDIFQSTRQLESHKKSHQSEASTDSPTIIPRPNPILSSLPASAPTPLASPLVSPQHQDVNTISSEDKIREMNMEIRELNAKLQRTEKELDECRKELKTAKALKKKQADEIKKYREDKKDCQEKVHNKTEEKEILTKENKLLKETVKANNELIRDMEKRAKNLTEDNHEKMDETEEKSRPVKKCNMCDFRANTEQQMNSHATIHHVKCNLCATVFGVQDELIEHLNEYHGDPRQTCKVCSYRAASDRHLAEHMDSQHDKDIRIQAVCKYWLRNSCWAGSDCRFKHPKVCRFQENCRNGQLNCRFYHDQKDKTKIQCRFQNRCAKPDCKLSHPFLDSRQFSLDPGLARPGINQPRSTRMPSVSQPTFQLPRVVTSQPRLSMNQKQMEEIVRRSM